MKRTLVAVFSIVCLIGCPVEDNPGCEKVMVCQEDSENFCDRNLDGCGKNCYYYIVETCWEECKKDVINEGR